MAIQSPRFESEDLLAIESSSNVSLARHERGVNVREMLRPSAVERRYAMIRSSVLAGRYVSALCFVGGVAIGLSPESLAAEDTASVRATETIVVAANRVATSLGQVATSTTIVTAEEIERRQLRTVSDVLRSVPGVDVVRSGGLGGNTVVFLRGANSEHTLVLIDGVEANNPITPNRAFNFADLSTENIERIEIVRGAQSTLYGSDALGGVINVVTRRGSGAPSGDITFEGGSYTTFTERASFRGATESMDYSLGLTRTDSGGISAADARDGNSEHDRYGLTGLSARLGSSLTENLEVAATARYEAGRSDIDDRGGVGGDDPNRRVRNENLFTRGQATLQLFDGDIEQIWGVGYADQRFDDDNDPDPVRPNDRLRSNYDGHRLKFDVQNNVRLSDDLRFVLGLETEDEEGSSTFRSTSDFGPFDSFLAERSVRTSGAYAQVVGGLVDELGASVGVRVDDHAEFGSEVTWRVAPTYTFSTGTKVAATVGTGYKAPSLFQLYSQFGFDALEPEESLSLDASIEQALGQSVTVGVTWYRNDFDNLITFDPTTFIFANIAAATTHGIESFVDADLGGGVSGRVTYTYLDSEDQATDDQLLRRARHKAGFDLRGEPVAGLVASIGGVLTGVREDNDFSTFPAARVTLPSYLVINLALEYAVSPRTKVFARVDNLFDREYSEVLGYGSLGAAGYAGATVTF